ncbi:hypothetical protein DFQ28_003066 [Apophysomyces sp. BC1034]|nr:hypothetical protein DFQ28_003066 [Apophysomyces sp. BC1034]
MAKSNTHKEHNRRRKRYRSNSPSWSRSRSRSPHQAPCSRPRSPFGERRKRRSERSKQENPSRSSRSRSRSPETDFRRRVLDRTRQDRPESPAAIPASYHPMSYEQETKRARKLVEYQKGPPDPITDYVAWTGCSVRAELNLRRRKLCYAGVGVVWEKNLLSPIQANYVLYDCPNVYAEFLAAICAVQAVRDPRASVLVKTSSAEVVNGTAKQLSKKESELMRPVAMMSGIGVKSDTEAEALLALKKLITIRPGRVFFVPSKVGLEGNESACRFAEEARNLRERPDSSPDAYPPEPVRRAFDMARRYEKSPETARKTRRIHGPAEGFMSHEAPKKQAAPYSSWGDRRESMSSASQSPSSTSATLPTPRWVATPAESVVENPDRSEAYRRVPAGSHRQIQLVQKIISQTQSSASREPQQSAFMDLDDQANEIVMNGNTALRSDPLMVDGDAFYSEQSNRQQENPVCAEPKQPGDQVLQEHSESKNEDADTKDKSKPKRASGVFAWVNRITDMFR